MSKRLISCAISVVLLIVSFTTAAADNAVKLRELSDCVKVFAYSGKDSAYFYGFNSQTLCSVRVIPDVLTRTVNVNGTILSVCHDDSNAYALYKNGQNAYCIMQMNMNSGDCSWFQIAQENTVQHSSIAACNGEVMVITSKGTDILTSAQNGNSSYTYSFPSGVKELFVNDNNAYALINDGSLYRIGSRSKTYSANLSVLSGFSNAGCGWMFTSGGALVSVNGEREYIHADAAVKLNGKTVQRNSVRLLACALDRAAALKNDYSLEYTGSDGRSQEEGASDKSKLKSGGIAVLEEGITVSKLKSIYSNVTGVYAANGEVISSGALRTGYTAMLESGSCQIAVLGDINGSGTVNSADTKLLMRFFTGSASLNDCEITAADCNKDGIADNRDLVLLSRMKK